MKSGRWWQYLIQVGLIAFLGFFLVLPLFTVISNGCSWQLLTEVFRNRIYTEALLNSLAIALTTTMLVIAIALPLALLYDRYDFPLRKYSDLLVLIPMVLPPFVGAIGFQRLFGYYGILNALTQKFGLPAVDYLDQDGCFWAVCVIEALHLYPIFYLNLVTGLGSIDPAYEEAAANLGVGKWRRFFGIKLPLLRSSFLAGGSIVLIWSFTELGTPLMLGYNRTTPVQIFNGLNELESNPVPYALVVVMLIASALMYLLLRIGCGVSSSSAGKGQSAVSRVRRLSSAGRWAASAVFALVALVSALPHLALILSAFGSNYYRGILPQAFSLEYFSAALSNDLVLPSIGNSLRYSLLAMAISTLFGLFIALAAVRWKLRGSRLADALAMLPLALPGVVTAFGYLGMSVRYAWVKAVLDPVENPLWLLAIAYAVRRIPYVLRSVSSGLEQSSAELEEAGRNFGVGAIGVLGRITVPLILTNLLVGALFAFSFSMLEVSDSLILAQKAQFYPITKALYDLSQILGFGPGIASAFGVWTMAFLLLSLAAALTIAGKKMRSVFRF